MVALHVPEARIEQRSGRDGRETHPIGLGGDFVHWRVRLEIVSQG